MVYVSVQNGTRAGIRTMKVQARDWTCPSCGKSLRYWWTACPNDKTPRPDR